MNLLYNCRLVSPEGISAPDGWILTDAGMITACGNGRITEITQDTVKTDCRGSLAMPGMIDCHVHFREPGMTSKATIATESEAAVAGGVTSFIEMPNTSPATVTPGLWQQKMEIAARDSKANYAFFIGANDTNIDTLRHLDYTRIPGIKLFVGSSTGDLLVTDKDVLKELFATSPALIAVHAEDQDILDKARAEILATRDTASLKPEDHISFRPAAACVAATSAMVDLARKYGTRLHICHLTTAEEVVKGRFFTPGDPAYKQITCEVAPAHLIWSREDYRRLGCLIKINPAVKELSDREALREALAAGIIDMVATDHAPHRYEEKISCSPLKAVSGAPMVQFALPMLMTIFSPSFAVEKYALNPAKVYRIDRRGKIAPGYYADIVLADDLREYPIAKDEIKSLCGFSPLEGVTPRYRILATIVNGNTAFVSPDCDISPLPDDNMPPMPLRFNRR